MYNIAALAMARKGMAMVRPAEERKYPEQSGELKAKLIADCVATLQR